MSAVDVGLEAWSEANKRHLLAAVEVVRRVVERSAGRG